MMPRQWNDEQQTMAKAMYAAGASAGQIARYFGITRNAILGRLHRMGATSPRKKGGQVKKKCFVFGHAPEPREPQAMPKMEAVAQSKPTRLIDATSSQCRWILDGYEQPTVCGAQGYPWCPEHRARAFSAAGPRKQLEAA